MNKQEFEKIWINSLMPSFQKMAGQDKTLFIREGSFESLCMLYNDIKNSTKRQFMLGNDDEIMLDRHKIAACMAKAILIDRPICRKIPENYTGAESDFMIANEILAFGVALSIIQAFIAAKLEKKDAQVMANEKAYRRICDEDFVFPSTIMKVDYEVCVCWAWHHNIIDGHFDLLGTANLFFMIENYSVEKYSK